MPPESIAGVDPAGFWIWVAAGEMFGVRDSDHRCGDWADKWYRETKLTSNISDSALTVIQGTIKHLNRYFEQNSWEDCKNDQNSAES